ncbi:MAG: hypothetical protein GTO45_26705 [Candidatus Aminicenantes bacterium]|nr:hypothetical protein [Candidatus Aminicenantes bacterium]NIM82336.1 hypothetical protein [Candidatus Aminicenantes bacterium]NIN21719.1 hypothetical protein [Candidatus Aminicenantes bacterium]NIN45528.1 hypothetical protein [Candidatus Aminicenantes bacterium]NIN88359.1 hypothetical protein [Candidatus Aminicenantes bacterium]
MSRYEIRLEEQKKLHNFIFENSSIAYLIDQMAINWGKEFKKAKGILDRNYPHWRNSDDARNAIPRLIAWLKEEVETPIDVDAYKKSTLVLVEIGKLALDPLIAALKDEHWAVRFGAANVLGMIKDPRSLEPLIYALARETESSGVMIKICEALTNIDSDWGNNKAARIIVPDLISAINDEANWRFRGEVMNTLGEIGDPRAIEPLIAVIKEENLDDIERGFAVSNLVKIAKLDVQPLITALMHEDEHIRDVLAEEVKEYGYQDFGRNPKEWWQEWWEKNKERKENTRNDR